MKGMREKIREDPNCDYRRWRGLGVTGKIGDLDGLGLGL
jgi:hypothetical protein